MLVWIKEHKTILITILFTIVTAIYLRGCQSTTPSLTKPNVKINRQELQLELDQIIGLAELRMVDLDRQDAFRAIILQNALLLVQGQPFNPVGIITAVAAIYGLTQGGCNITKVIKNKTTKRKENNGST